MKVIINTEIKGGDIKVTSIGFVGKDREEFKFTEENFEKLVEAVRIHWGLDEKGLQNEDRT